MVLEADSTIHLGEQGVVLTEPDVEPGSKPAPALTHEDGTTRHNVAVVTLDAKTLRIAVAPVAGAALSFFVRNKEKPYPRNTRSRGNECNLCVTSARCQS